MSISKPKGLNARTNARSIIIDLSAIVRHYVERRPSNWDGSTESQAWSTLADAKRFLEQTPEQAFADELGAMKRLSQFALDNLNDLNRRNDVKGALEAILSRLSDF